MEETAAEDTICRLAAALGVRLTSRSPLELAEVLEDVVFLEAARASGLTRDDLLSLPPQALRARPELVAR
jgi:hypothetical protein